MKIKLHPLFVLFALVTIVTGRGLSFCATFVAVSLHECAHAFVARNRGFVLGELVLLPYGAVLWGDEQFDRRSELCIALAGPLANIMVAVCLLASWWLFPAVYPYTRVFFFANVSIALVNLFPAFPLDGARAVLGSAHNRLKALRILRWTGVVASFALFVAFIASVFSTINFSFGIFAVFMFLGATSGTKKESYRSVLSAQAKNYALGVTERTVKMLSSAPLRRFFHYVKPDCAVHFEVVDGDGATLFEFDESELKQKCLDHSLSEKVATAFDMAKNVDGRGKNKPNEIADGVKNKTRKREYGAKDKAVDISPEKVYDKSNMHKRVRVGHG